MKPFIELKQLEVITTFYKVLKVYRNNKIRRSSFNYIGNYLTLKLRKKIF
jgi:hypothetical protein